MNGFRQGNSDAEAQLPLRLTDIRHVAVSGGADIGFAEDMHWFIWRQKVAHQMGEGVDADHLSGAHVVGLTGLAVL